MNEVWSDVRILQNDEVDRELAKVDPKDDEKMKEETLDQQTVENMMEENE